jgi:transposase InsO family protein
VGAHSKKEVSPMRLSPERRSLIGTMIDKLSNKSFVAKLFNVSRKTIYRWDKRRKHVKDRKRKPKKRKVTLAIEKFILALRTTFGWGTERIRKGLLSIPKFMRDTLKKLGVCIVQKVTLSRSTINDVLKKHKLNGYAKKREGWKFFRAEKPDELWQLDPKGPIRTEGKKHWFVICIDDYSRYIILAKHFTYCPSVEEIKAVLITKIKKRKPANILTDNNPFKEEWDKWCKEHSIKPLHAHPYYPQDKGKVERAIRNFNEEFIYLLKKFPEWLDNLPEYVRWFNHKRYHAGVRDFPAQLYT